MNLVVSGPFDAPWIETVRLLTKARRVVSLHAAACRFEQVDDGAATRTAVTALCDRVTVDHAFVDIDIGIRSFGLLAMDMDSTLITIECIDEIADFIGKKKEVAAITEAAMRGEIGDFAESLTRRVALLAGTDARVLAQVFDEKLRLSPGAEALIGAAKAAKLHTLLVSGGFTYFTDRLVDHLKLDTGHSNRLEIADGKLTGRVLPPIFDSAAKARTVRDALATLDVPASAALVVGDGANDIPMMNLVDHSVAYHGKPAVVQAARYAVRYGNLATVLDYIG